MTNLLSWNQRSVLRWTAVFVALIIGMAAVLELEIRSAGVQASGEPAVEVDDGHRLLFVIIDSLAPENAAKMESFQRLSKQGWSATIEPCLERMTKMCIEEMLTGRTAFSLFGFLRNLGPVDGGVGPNLLRDARARGQSVAMLSRGDLSLLDSDADEHIKYKNWKEKREINKVLALTKTHDLVVYHYAWHDLSSHRYRRGTRKYKASVRQLDKAMARLIDETDPAVDIIMLGDHGHTADGRHLQGLDTPTMLAVRSDRVRALDVDERIHITVARFLAGLIMGVHSPDSAWPAEWAAWAAPDAAAGLPAPTMVPGDNQSVERAWFVLIPIAVMVLFLGRVGGVWPVVFVTVVGLAMGFGWEVFMDRVHYARGISRGHQVSHWVPIAGGVLGLLAGRRLQSMWAGVVMAIGMTCLLLYPLIYHYGIFRNAHWLMMGLTLAPAAVWLVRRRSLLAVLVGVYAWTMWPELTRIKVTNLEVRNYRAMSWMRDTPLDGLVLLAALAFLCHLFLEQGRWRSRIGWSLVAMAGVVLTVPTGLRMAAFSSILLIPLVPHHLRARSLGLVSMWSMPLLFPTLRSIGVLAAVLGTAGVLLAVRGAMNKAQPGRLWAWGGGISLALAAHVAFGWTFGINVAGIDFGFTLEFLPGDLHERLWWVIGIWTTLKLMLPVIYMTTLVRTIFGPGGRAIVEVCGLATMLRAFVVIMAALTWMFAPDSSAGGTLLASVLQDGFYWALIGLMSAVTWVSLERGRRASDCAAA